MKLARFATNASIRYFLFEEARARRPTEKISVRAAATFAVIKYSLGNLPDSGDVRVKRSGAISYLTKRTRVRYVIGRNNECRPIYIVLHSVHLVDLAYPTRQLFLEIGIRERCNDWFLLCIAVPIRVWRSNLLVLPIFLEIGVRERCNDRFVLCLLLTNIVFNVDERIWLLVSPIFREIGIIKQCNVHDAIFTPRCCRDPRSTFTQCNDWFSLCIVVPIWV